MTKNQFLKYLEKNGWYTKSEYYKSRFLYLEHNFMEFRCELRNNSYRIERNLIKKGWVRFCGGSYTNFKSPLVLPALRPIPQRYRHHNQVF